MVGIALMSGAQFALLSTLDQNGSGIVGVFTPGASVSEFEPVDRASYVIEQSLLLSREVMNREITDEDVPEIVNGALQALDPYSGYVREEMANRITGEERPQGKGPLMVGIIGDVRDDGYFVRSAAPMSPADKADIRSGDRLVQIDDLDISQSSGKEAIEALKEATQASDGKELQLVFEREMSRVNVAITPKVLPESHVYDMGVVDGVLHITLRGFFTGVVDDVERVVERNMNRENIEGIVLDLRGNSGGLTSETKKLAELFFPIDTMLYTEEGRVIEKTAVWTEEPPVFPGMKMAVLIDGYSASASEIFASAVQSWSLGAVIGQTSYGKGTIQNVYPFEDGSGAIKITVGEYKSAGGEEIQGVGVIPDIVVEEEVEVFQEKDPVFDAAVKYIKGV